MQENHHLVEDEISVDVQKCMTQLVVNVAKTAKYHFDQQDQNQFFVAIVSREIPTQTQEIATSRDQIVVANTPASIEVAEASEVMLEMCRVHQTTPDNLKN